MAALVALANVYTCIFEMQGIADPTEKWRNTYDFFSPTPPTTGDAIIAALAGYQTQMVSDQANIISTTVYAWSRGTHPYPGGLPIFTITGAVPGTGESAWGFVGPFTNAGGEVCLRIDREPTGGGRAGHIFYRGLIPVEETSQPVAGHWRLKSGTIVTQSRLNSIIAAPGLTAFFGAGSSGRYLCIVRYGPKHGGTPIAQQLTGFGLINLTTNRQTRKNKK